MSDRLAVLLGDVVAGTLERGANGRLAFTYDNAYTGRPAPTPLSLSLPTQVRRHAGAALDAWLWGLLPDNDAVLRRWSREFKVSATSPFALLSTPVGEDCAGAVRFVRPDRVHELQEQPGTVDWLTENEIGERLRELRAAVRRSASRPRATTRTRADRHRARLRASCARRWRRLPPTRQWPGSPTHSPGTG